MKIDSFVIAWNEENKIQEYLDYYGKFVNKITLLDNNSTDRTVEIAKAFGCDIIHFGGAVQDNRQMKQVKDACWKNSKADWVIVGDMDEFLYSSVSLRNALKDLDATIIKPTGYQMVSELALPFNKVKTGKREPIFDKMLCFRPDALEEINYSYGCHEAFPIGKIKIFENYDSLFKLLHYNLIGRQEWINRCRSYIPRMSQWDIQNGAGSHYLWSDEQFNSCFDSILKEAIEVW